MRVLLGLLIGMSIGAVLVRCDRHFIPDDEVLYAPQVYQITRRF